MYSKFKIVYLSNIDKIAKRVTMKVARNDMLCTFHFPYFNSASYSSRWRYSQPVGRATGSRSVSIYVLLSFIIRLLSNITISIQNSILHAAKKFLPYKKVTFRA